MPLERKPGATKLRIYQSACRDVKYVYDKPVPWEGHERHCAVHEQARNKMNQNGSYDIY